MSKDHSLLSSLLVLRSAQVTPQALYLLKVKLRGCLRCATGHKGHHHCRVEGLVISDKLLLKALSQRGVQRCVTCQLRDGLLSLPPKLGLCVHRVIVELGYRPSGCLVIAWAGRLCKVGSCLHRHLISGNWHLGIATGPNDVSGHRHVGHLLIVSPVRVR